MSVGYPNLENPDLENLPIKAPCARPCNIKKAVGAFTRVCPSGLVITEAKPLPFKVRPFCRWLIEYCKEDRSALPSLGSKDLKAYFKKLKPPFGASKMSQHYINKSSIGIIYKLGCDCQQPLDFYDGVDSPPEAQTKEEVERFDTYEAYLENFLAELQIE